MATFRARNQSLITVVVWSCLVLLYFVHQVSAASEHSPGSATDEQGQNPASATEETVDEAQDLPLKSTEEADKDKSQEDSSETKQEVKDEELIEISQDGGSTADSSGEMKVDSSEETTDGDNQGSGGTSRNQGGNTDTQKVVEDGSKEQPNDVHETPVESENITFEPDTEAGSDAIPVLSPPIDGVDLSRHDILSFDEYRKEFYENDTKINGVPQKVYEPQPAVLKVTPPSSPHTELRNYASHECGAKVINSNNEAQYVDAVVNEDRDKYVMQPCSARKWLVIELCEPVVVRKIAIGNLEAFSSTFENFTVYISKSSGGKERPGKDWHSIGTFHAKDERGVQGFTIDQFDHYTSFIKVEINSHYGNEHYCPITIIRVYGTGVDDDDDDIPPPADETQQEEKVPSTESPPIAAVETPSDANNSEESFIFPPQPWECFMCYDTLNMVPDYCWPEHFYLPIDELPYRLHTTPKDQSVPCIQSSAEPTEDVEVHQPSADSKAESKADQQAESMDTTMDSASTPPPTVAISSPAKVQPTPTATEVPSGSVQPTQTATVPTTHTTQATTQDSDSSDNANTGEVQPSQVDLVLPSPPTLAEPPTAVNEVTEEVTMPTTETVQVTEEESTTEEDGELEDTANSSDPPPPAARHGKRSSIGRLSNQVKSLELNLQVTNRYLEEMSIKSKNQKDDLQRALNNTMRSLQNTTLKLEIMTKDYMQLKEKTIKLSEQLAALQEHVHQNETIGWFTPLISLGTLLLAVFISKCITRNYGINRAEVARILEDLPDSPLRRGHKRSGSDSNIIAASNEEKKQTDKQLKKAKSYAAFNSVSVSNVGVSEEAEPIGVFEQPMRRVTDVHDTGATVDNLSHYNISYTEQSPDIQPPIEIISPTTWRTFNTPDGKSDKTRKKGRTSKTKSSKSQRRGNLLIAEERSTITDQSGRLSHTGDLIDQSTSSSKHRPHHTVSTDHCYSNGGTSNHSPQPPNKASTQPPNKASTTNNKPSIFNIFRRSSEF